MRLLSRHSDHYLLSVWRTPNARVLDYHFQGVRNVWSPRVCFGFGQIGEGHYVKENPPYVSAVRAVNARLPAAALESRQVLVPLSYFNSFIR